MVAANVDGSLVELPIKVPWKQHFIDYMDELPKQLGVKPASPALHYQLTNISPLKRMSTPPPDSVPLDNLSYKQPLMPTPVADQGLRHVAVAHSLCNLEEQHQQLPLPPPSCLGESNSELKQMMTTNVAEKEPALACFFCRKRKNRPGWPHLASDDQTFV
jgi:hypothetical protein